MNNLPCHLRDDMWLAKMLNKYQNLSNISFNKMLNYIIELGYQYYMDRFDKYYEAESLKLKREEDVDE